MTKKFHVYDIQQTYKTICLASSVGQGIKPLRRMFTKVCRRFGVQLLEQTSTTLASIPSGYIK